MRLVTGFDFEVGKDLQNEFKKGVSRVPDFIHEVELKDRSKAIVHMEFQTKMHSYFSERMLLYYALAKDRFKDKPVYQFVIYIGESKIRLEPLHTHPSGWSYRYSLIKVNAIDYSMFLSSPRSEEVLFAALGSYPNEKTEEVVEAVIRKVYRLSGSREEFLKRMYQLAGLSALRKENLSFVPEKVKDMPIHISPEEIKEVSKTNPYFAVGKQEGKQEAVIKMLEKNLDLELIAEISGLTLEEIQKLKKENSD